MLFDIYCLQIFATGFAQIVLDRENFHNLALKEKIFQMNHSSLRTIFHKVEIHHTFAIMQCIKNITTIMFFRCKNLLKMLSCKIWFAFSMLCCFVASFLQNCKILL